MLDKDQINKNKQDTIIKLSILMMIADRDIHDAEYYKVIEIIEGSENTSEARSKLIDYFSLTGKSFRTNDSNNLIQHTKTQTQSLIVFEDGKSIKITKKKNSKPHILQNRGEKTENFTKLIKKYPNCLIENKEFFFTTSNPEQKRNFLNKTLFYVEQTDALL